MTKIQNLIDTLCPNGVEFKKLGELCETLPKGTLKTSQIKQKQDEFYKYPVINSGRDLYGYYNLFNNDFALTLAARGEYAGCVNFFDSKFWAGGLCYPYKLKDNKRANLKFIYYFLKDKEQIIRSELVAEGSIPALNKSDIENFEIPVPPLEVQSEIVRILDNFALLTAELTARKKQYEFYRNALLTFDENVEFKKLGELLSYEQPTKYLVTNTNYNDKHKTPVLTAGQSFILGYTDDEQDICQANKNNPIIIFDDFTTATKWVDFPFKVKSSAMKLLTLKVSYCHLKFLFYVIQTIDYKPSSHARQWITEYSQIEIPIPPIEIQNKIVEILDKFENLTNDLTQGLPAEIQARQKQYEYYREKLLTFKRASSRHCERGEAIQKEKKDCHDLTASSLAMTEKEKEND